jgi:hypothetical protein
MTTEHFMGIAMQGEWLIEVINEGNQTHNDRVDTGHACSPQPLS